MAVAEGYIERNPASLLFTPREAVRATRRIMNIEDVKTCFRVLDQRERLVVKLPFLPACAPERFSLLPGARWPLPTSISGGGSTAA
jgi:hypothetical protein